MKLNVNRVYFAMVQPKHTALANDEFIAAVQFSCCCVISGAWWRWNYCYLFWNWIVIAANARPLYAIQNGHFREPFVLKMRFLGDTEHCCATLSVSHKQLTTNIHNNKM